MAIAITTMVSMWMTPLIQTSKLNLEKDFIAKIIMYDITISIMDGYKYEFPLFEVLYMCTIMGFVISASSFVAIYGFFIVLAIHNETQHLEIKYSTI